MGGSAFPDTERLSETEYQRIVSQVNHATAMYSENDVDLFIGFRVLEIFFIGFRVAEEKES